ncbi:MAG TPA: MlaD family protein [Stellaceae bacterium]|nr:MlaD family protein [Stellaceae bacterium]
METRAHYVAVGAFVLTMIVLAFAAVLWLARAELTTQYGRYDIYFRGPVTGLRNGGLVEYSGVPAGKVIDVRIDPDNVEQIRVTVEIDNNIVIKDDARASVETNILSGVSYIQIVGGTQNAPVLSAKAGERYPVIKAHRSRLAGVVARAPELIEKIDQALDSANQLLNEKNRQAFSASLDNIRTFTGGLAERNKDIAEFTANAKQAAAGLAEFVGNVDRSYSGPDGIGNRAATALADFDRVAKNLNDTNRQLQLMVQDVRPGVRNFSQQTLGDVASLIADGRQLIASLNRLTGQISRNPSLVLYGDRREGYRPR